MLVYRLQCHGGNAALPRSRDPQSERQRKGLFVHRFYSESLYAGRSAGLRMIATQVTARDATGRARSMLTQVVQCGGAQFAPSVLQVALLFLVKVRIPTEPIWTAFIASAAELSLVDRVPPPAPRPPTLLPSTRQISGESPQCQGRYAVPTRVREKGSAHPIPACHLPFRTHLLKRSIHSVQRIRS
jgi:hypothetical protein